MPKHNLKAPTTNLFILFVYFSFLSRQIALYFLSIQFDIDLFTYFTYTLVLFLPINLTLTLT